MRKANNKFRGNNNSNNSNNAIYSLNYKFDSVSAAGKFSGTALDLIKKYNELAKEAQGNGNYVEMEVYRQYAEHYRKIVTEINERKNQMRENAPMQSQNAAVSENSTETETVASSESLPVADNGLVETLPAEQKVVEAEPVQVAPRQRARRGFTIVEVVKPEGEENSSDQAEKSVRKTRKPRLVKNKIDEAL